MSLTPNDFQQISKLLDEQLDVKFKQNLAPIYKILEKHEKLLRQHSKELQAIKKTQETMLDVVDRKLINHDKRIDRIETHLDLTTFVS